jgi:iron complex outermembrane recepter protein
MKNQTSIRENQTVNSGGCGPVSIRRATGLTADLPVYRLAVLAIATILLCVAPALSTGKSLSVLSADESGYARSFEEAAGSARVDSLPNGTDIPAGEMAALGREASVNKPASCCSIDSLRLRGEVRDRETGRPLSGAHVIVREAPCCSTRKQTGTVTGADGSFALELDETTRHILITHVGYRTKRVDGASLSDETTIFLEPVTVFSEDILITAGRLPGGYTGLYSDARTRPVEDHLSHIPGMDLVSRANFAKDPVIRGQRDGRITVTIDGMRMTPACVDGMDPLTAYIEPDNLQAVEINRGQDAREGGASGTGGSVNFAMARPVLNTGTSATLESGYHSVSSQHLLQGGVSHGSDRWAFRVSGTYRNAGDFRAGSGEKMEGSGFEKGNIYSALLVRPDDDHTLSLRYIGDFAGFIGYPRLLMDTRRADAHIAGLEHLWDRTGARIHTIRTDVYMNRVAHWMDDYGRDVTRRDVMPDMFMPMYGETVTGGVATQMDASTGSRTLQFHLEAWNVEAFADMLMGHVDPGVRDMYLVNMGDVSQRNVLAAVRYRRYLDGGWTLGGRLQLEGSLSRIREESAVATYKAEYPEMTILEPVAFGYIGAMQAEKMLRTGFSGGVRISHGTRLPDHLERYGYYIYQPMDGFFYIGNPELEPERSSQAEGFLTLGDDRSRWSGHASVWVNRMDRYIAGQRIDDLFKRYDNMGRAVLTGFEIEVDMKVSDRWRTGGAASRVIGQHSALNEPLPIIPPLKGHGYLRMESQRVSLEGRVRWAAAQDRIASVNSLETRTPGHVLFDLHMSARITDHVRLRGGLENIGNRHYVDHLSVNELPGTGRNIYVSLRLAY